MYMNIKKADQNVEKNYSSMTMEEKNNLKIRIMHDALNFSQNFSYSNYLNYQYLSQLYATNVEELKHMEKIVNEINIDINKKNELFKVAQENIPLFYYPLNNMYNEGELQYFGNCIIPYVRKQEEINEIQKQMFNAYQNCVIYNNTFELWMNDFDSLNKSIIFEKYKNKNKNQRILMNRELQEAVHVNKIEKIKRRIRRHVYKDNNNIYVSQEHTREYKDQPNYPPNPQINFDDWL
ncbi:conserved Plasmodium protein, unknown function [Plasmodium berghei]|uniref:Uncharacterized protein n=2 Tax=Plasmodium berghei TaxID=5821 RepID=A0A509AR85_PLABA|nr:conserved Plasmodium protein, unknown function [Plasmodium berghei ANKA]CXI88470.1 conserved Plasmodium protein, unknown function [Plasmodium berghei]SCL95945.1 conserved Plasmodium protein, unknown function [Plasmodium berghei]SCM16322.1 conserved Plasmodium protein, unknown function [Plasmodium berghei]SCM18118.1 conserved Plasmodium protein, unknown function [Plasmodium berghei]SCN27545.1 conserved Plasmodium protein, unknown function [Plasmodium berghei]|eukprot:XP_034423201.1 conserved Plasmodium protein, unknown function [Plasmodium berghei ANKA]